MSSIPPGGRRARVDVQRLARDLRRLQTEGYPDLPHPSVDLHFLLESVSQRLLHLTTTVAAMKYGGAQAALGLEPSDLGAEAARRLLEAIPRLQLDGPLEQCVGRLWNWVNRQVDWVAAEAGRRTGRVQHWWWEVCREDCWRHYWPDWRACLLVLPAAEAREFRRELRERFFALSFRELLRYPGPKNSEAGRAIMRVIRADLREWAKEFTEPMDVEMALNQPAQDQRSSPEAAVLRATIAAALGTALISLEDQMASRGKVYRRLLELRYLEGLSLPQICLRLEQEGLDFPGSNSTAMRWLRLAEGELRELLLQQGLTEADFRRARIREARPAYGAELARPLDVCLTDAELAAYALALPDERHAAWQEHLGDCKACQGRLRASPPSLPELAAVVPPLSAENVQCWPRQDRVRLWADIAAAARPMEDRPPPSHLAELPAVDAEQRLVLQLCHQRPGAKLELAWSLGGRRELLLGSVTADAQGGAELRVPCALPLGEQLDAASLLLRPVK